jgi:hypothetical protein
VTYPRVVTCRVTGIKAMVESAEEERAFHRATFVPMVIGAVIIVVATLALIGFAIWARSAP